MSNFLRAITKLEEAIAVLSYLLVFLFLFSEIIAREFFSKSITASENLATLASVAAGFVGYSLVTQTGDHLRATFLDWVTKPIDGRLRIRIENIVSSIILGYLAVIASQFVHESYRYSEKIEILYWPLWPFQSVLVYALGASALKSIIFAVFPDFAPHSIAVQVSKVSP